jgi:hypothetical protein
MTPSVFLQVLEFDFKKIEIVTRIKGFERLNRLQ